MCASALPGSIGADSSTYQRSRLLGNRAADGCTATTRVSDVFTTAGSSKRWTRRSAPNAGGPRRSPLARRAVSTSTRYATPEANGNRGSKRIPFSDTRYRPMIGGAGVFVEAVSPPRPAAPSTYTARSRGHVESFPARRSIERRFAGSTPATSTECCGPAVVVDTVTAPTRPFRGSAHATADTATTVAPSSVAVAARRHTGRTPRITSFSRRDSEPVRRLAHDVE